MTDLDLLKHHIVGFHRTRTWKLNEVEKDALVRLSKKVGYSLNKYCGNCVTNALKKCYHLVKEPEAPQKPDISNMTYRELRELQKSLGAKYGRTKDEIMQNILDVM